MTILDSIVSAIPHMAPPLAPLAPRFRTRKTKKGMRHTHNRAGAKLAKKAAAGKLTCRHGYPIHSMV